MKKVGIVGGGSIGLLLGAYLSKGGQDVTIYTKSQQQATSINEFGLSLSKNSDEFNFKVISRPFHSAESIDDEVVFIAVKQYDLKEVVSRVSKLNSNIKSIIFVQNGMSHISSIENLMPIVNKIYVAVIEHGALKKADNHVIHTGEGEMKVGCYYNLEKEQNSWLWQQLTNSGFLTKSYNNWLKLLVDKLIINSVINPLTALYRVENGALIKNKYFFKIMREVFEELSLVFECDEGAWQQIIRVCDNTSRNRSSMLKDIEEGRRTEIDAITGFVLKRAAQKQISLHYNTFLYNSIKGLEKGGVDDE